MRSMSKKALIIFSVLVFFPISAFSSGALEAQQKKQQLQQQAAANQILQQKQQAISQAKQQYLTQQQQIVQQAKQQQALLAQQQAAQLQALQQKQQALVQSNQFAQTQAQAQAMQAAYLQNAQAQMPATGNFSQNPQAQAAFQSLTQGLSNNINLSGLEDLSQTQDVKTLAEVWQAFEKSSEAWALIIDLQPKIITVQRQIALYRDQGITINKDPMHYVQLIDSISQENSNLLKQPFKDVLKFVAIIEYDFDNGQDKDALAQHLLGDAYLANKQRLGL